MIFDAVREILARQLEISPEGIRRDTDIMEDLGADSLDMVEFVMAIEEEYDIVITDESVGNMTTVGQISDFLEKLL
ncbi:MAG: acyl carrier protein [Clostridia bacterium]|nr:acyl carrier protein [Clostridia bacterium]NCC68579.1 acyl carrier protein [Clostridia bacterium]